MDIQELSRLMKVDPRSILSKRVEPFGTEYDIVRDTLAAISKVRIAEREITLPGLTRYRDLIMAVLAEFKDKEKRNIMPLPYAKSDDIVIMALRPEHFGLYTWKKVAKDFHDKFIERAGNWSVLNPLRNALADVFYWIGYVAGAAMNYMWDIMIKPKIDEVTNNVEKTIESTVIELVSRINSSISRLVSSTNVAIDNVSKSLSDAVEKAIEEWYKAIGLEKGQLPQWFSRQVRLSRV